MHKHITETETETIERFIGADESLKLRLMLMPFSTRLYENKASFHLIGVIRSRMQKKKKIDIYIYRFDLLDLFVSSEAGGEKKGKKKNPPPPPW